MVEETRKLSNKYFSNIYCFHQNSNRKTYFAQKLYKSYAKLEMSLARRSIDSVRCISTKIAVYSHITSNSLVFPWEWRNGN